MPKEVVGKIPEFTGEGVEEEKETPSGDLPPETKPIEETAPPVSEAEKTQEKELDEDSAKEGPEIEIETIGKELEGLLGERDNILEEIKTLRGERRQLKEEDLKKVETDISAIEGVNPEDLKILDQYAKSRGLISRTDYLKEINQQKLNEFLDKYPEYKPENDKDDKNWVALKGKLDLLREAKNPAQLVENLELARQMLSSTLPRSDRAAIEAKLQQLRSGSVGSKGKTGSSVSSRTKSSGASRDVREEALRRGGFSDEEIDDILLQIE